MEIALIKMEWDDLQKELRRRNIADGSYVEVTLTSGEILFGKYGRFGEQGGINLYNARQRWQHYNHSLIGFITKIPTRTGELPDDILETLVDCGETFGN